MYIKDIILLMMYMFTKIEKVKVTRSSQGCIKNKQPQTHTFIATGNVKVTS